MSTNEPARLHSRRAFLSSTAAVAAFGASVAPALPAEPDPVFALIEAERLAMEALDASVITWGRAEAALWRSEWDRQPRVQTATYTSTVRGPNFDPIPFDEQVGEPVYVHDHEAIDRDCDDHAKAPGVSLADVQERRARLHRELREDAAVIATAPEVMAEKMAERLNDAAGDTHMAALRSVFAQRPTTVAGLVASLDLFELRTEEGLDLGEQLPAILRSVRHFLAGRA